MRVARQAFTLVELVLTVTFFSALMATVGGLLRMGLSAHATFGTATAPYLAYERALAQLADDVASAQPFFGMPASGRAVELTLPRVDTVTRDDGTRAPAWVRVTYRFTPDDGGTLVREATPWQPDGPAPAPESQRALLTRVEGTFRYQVLGPDGQPAWVDVWDGEAHGVPQRVEFAHAVSLPSGGGAWELARVFRNPAGSLPTVEAP